MDSFSFVGKTNIVSGSCLNFLLAFGCKSSTKLSALSKLVGWDDWYSHSATECPDEFDKQLQKCFGGSIRLSFSL